MISRRQRMKVSTGTVQACRLGDVLHVTLLRQVFPPLTLHLKEQYWTAIRDGRKTEEYRLRTHYWEKRLTGKQFSEVRLLLGYPKRGDDTKTLRRAWTGYRLAEVQADLFGPAPVLVYAIDVSQSSCDR